MRKITLIIICFVIGILVYFKSEEIIIPTDAIRIRIIANSNSINDLYQKKILKEEIKKDIYILMNNVNSSLEADYQLNENLGNIKKIVSQRTNDFEINYGYNHFPKKTYKGVVYPEGDYKSLVITLGKGMGDNWWCVLYPPLCLIEDNQEIGNVEYRLFVSDILDN